ncbi:MAG: hypothetical protein JWN84_2287 [Nocardioides sp.]|nr:hypothetical protein [Nocardioides sp.]
MPRPNPLLRFFRQYEGPRIHKWIHYFEIYHRHFARFRDEPVTILEFGVNQGGSLRMWQHYFHDDSKIVGVDIDERCRQFEGGNVSIEIGDQEDREFLRMLAEKHGPFDVVIEDGGHQMGQQIASFEEIYPAMSEDGCFLIEDLHTSYWPGYGGGLLREGTFIEYAKRLSDQLNAWHSKQDDFVVDRFTETTRSMHFYDSVIVFERGAMTKPRARKRGYDSFNVNDGQGREPAG